MSRNFISLSVPPIRLELPAAATSAVQNGRLASLIFRNRERMIPSPLFVYVFPDQPHNRQQYGSQNRRNDPLNF